MSSRGRSRRRGAGRGGGRSCHNCGGSGHIARECRSKGPNRSTSPHGHQPRSHERRFFDLLTKNEETSIGSVDEAVRLMNAALGFAATDGGPALLYRLNEKAGSDALKKCLEYITINPSFEDGFLPLIERLAQDDLNKPVYDIPMNSILSKIYELPFLMPAIKSLAAEWIPRGSNDRRTVLAWFLAKISLVNNDARTNTDILSVAEQLAGVGCGDHLKTILGGNLMAQVSLSQIRDNQTETPGGRHDNDKEDFRSISIIPTCQEFLSDADPYLPVSMADGQTTEASLLDRQFRLLREDILGPSKEVKDNPKAQQKDIFYGARPVSVESGVAVKNLKGEKVVGESDPCIMFRFEMPRWFRVNFMKTFKEKEEYWGKNNRILPRDALVCLERKNNDNEWEPIRFGTIVRRETKDLLSPNPMIGIAFDSAEDWDMTTAELSDRSLPPTRLFIVSAVFFAYQPILRGLQLMTEIPFQHEIVHAKPSLQADEDAIEIPDQLKTTVDALDPGQRHALDVALKDRVALIQGPPGTGKTFLGILLAQIFQSATTHTILVVTFTNHALDDVLEALMDVGITGIVRLGGRSRSEKLSQFNLRELGKSKAPFSREQTRRFAQLKEEIEQAKQDVERLRRVLSREIGEKWWDTVGAHLQHSDPESYQHWLKNKHPPATLQDRAQGTLWNLSSSERRHKKFEWQHEIYESQRSELVLALKTIKRARDELKSLQQVTDAHILSKAKVIGCTTTKAAMCKSLLAGSNAGIVLVEEAAEILEAHVLTSLNPGVKRLVMIGDHKQLRPKCQHYPLTVESNRGFDLNCSLFERLANANPISTLGIQHRMHPDISSIPRLVTYNKLQDAPSTNDHPCVCGLSSRVIFINHHSPEDNINVGALESVSKTNCHERDMVVHIVKYILKQGYLPSDIVVLTPYLGQMLKLQADLEKHLAVLLDERDINDARDQLRGDDNFAAELGQTRSNSNRARPSSASTSSIRVATVDNYQGEESKVVVVSLVRSNSLGQIGFLREPERVNVMLSRARECEIIIGNRSTLEDAKGSLHPLKGGVLWRKIFDHLDENGQVFYGLPTICQNHGTQRILVSPKDFDAFCRDGGCTETCGKSLKCGHLCPSYCHPGKCTALCVELCEKELDCGHPCKSLCHSGGCPKCRVICSDICCRGHPLRKECGSDILPNCRRDITWLCPLNHVVSGPCHAGKFGVDCQICIDLQHEEDEIIRREAALSKILSEKQIRLAKLKNDIEEKKRSKMHDTEIATIEKELELAEKELEDFLTVGAKEGDSQRPQNSNKAHSRVTENVLLLLNKQDSLPLSGFSEVYLKEFGTNIADDANEESETCTRSKKRRKLKEILENLVSDGVVSEPLCDIVVPSSSKKPNGKRPHYVIRLRRSAGDLVPDNPPLKVRKVEHASQASEGLHACKVIAANSGKKLAESAPTVLMAATETNEAAIAPSAEAPSMNVNVLNRDASSRILPPLPDDENIQEVGSFVANVICRYMRDGPIKADDLLDEIVKSIEGTPIAVKALRFMLEQDLNPGGDLKAPEYKATADQLTNALCITAKAIDMKQKYPLQAREFAQKALTFAQGLEFPLNWMDELNAICDNPMTKQNAHQTKVANEFTPLEAWKAILQQDPAAPSVMNDSVLPMIGLDAVKQSLIGMYHRFKLAQEQGDGAASSYNVRFEGNPGTGKTTIARHYGLFLQQLQILPEGSLFQETNGAKLIQGGVKGLQDLLADLKKKGGGVVFVDEAYQLASDREGKKVLDFILPLAESLSTEYGSLVWIFAGYKKPLEKLFEHNEGLPSRFPLRFVFEDYTDDELAQIFRDMMEFMPPQLGKSDAKKTKQTSTYSSQNSDKYSYSTYPPSRPNSNGNTKVCRFGLTWTYVEYSGWTDKYGNRTLDPMRVGTISSNLVDRNGDIWIEDNSMWRCSNGTLQDFYPGSPAPIKKSKRLPRHKPFHCNEQHLMTAIKRLGRRREDRGFGNARSVRVLFENIRDRQALRITRERSQCSNPDIFLFERVDLLGPDLSEDSLKRSKAWSDLEQLEGLLPVKESVEQLFRLVLRNAEREKRGEAPLGVSLNRLFLGNPGTGKTSVAALYGRILADLGLLSKGEVILKCASDFVGDALGVSEKTTQGILKSAEGCVLVIDEAYSLYTGGGTGSGTNDPYKTAVIDTIVEKVQARPGADIAVVMIGYQKEMENMLNHVNPGLSRRFQIDEAFHFPDFDNSALVRIMIASARKRGVELDVVVAKRAVATLARARSRPNFGNAGAVDNLLSKAITRMQMRDQTDKLTLVDFEYDGDGPDEALLESLFDDLIGCKSVKETMLELRNTVLFSQAQGKDAASSGVGFNYLFLGNPGTGKTTVARKMGKMFKALGLLPGDDLIEAKASDLVTGYTGQAGKCTRELLRKSLGGVLFIDEAYQLDPARGGSYMTEAVDELVGALTEEEFKGKILVILAGYDSDMEKMLKTNPGLQSRFSERVHFHDFDKDDVVDLLLVELEKAGIPLCEPADKLANLATLLIAQSGDSFGNGRDIVTWAGYVYKVVAKKYSQEAAKLGMSCSFSSSLDDVEAGLKKILESRRIREGGQTCASVDRSFDKPLVESEHMNKDLPPVAKAIKASNEMGSNPDVSENVVSEKDTGVMDLPANIFDELGSDVLKTLQAFIDEHNLGSEEGAHHLADIDSNSLEFHDLVTRLSKDTGLSFVEASEQLLKWQSLQKDLEAMIENEKQKSKIVGTRPIWRCGVCGRADKPWIACYVAPFIVGYEDVALGGMS